MRNPVKIMMMAALMGALAMPGYAQGNRPGPGAPMEQLRGPRPDDLIKRHKMDVKRAEKFQKVFFECQRDMEEINHMRQANLTERRNAHTNKDMKRIIREESKIEKKMLKAKEKYYKAFCAYMPPLEAERLVDQLAAMNNSRERGIIIPRRDLTPGGPAEPQMNRNRNRGNKGGPKRL